MEGWTLWLTGLPASGKTTLACALQETLAAQGITAVVLDSDKLRHIFTPTPTYTDAERDEFYRSVVQLAGLLNLFGIDAIIAATAPRRAYRDLARQTLARFAEVWVDCPLAVCEARDPKGLYQQARAGVITRLPGIGSCYEPPLQPEVMVKSNSMTIAEMVATLVKSVPWLLSPS